MISQKENRILTGNYGEEETLSIVEIAPWRRRSRISHNKHMDRQSLRHG